MKKSVILTIGVIYVIAIVVVGFIGLKMQVYNQQKYVEKITCISEGYHKYPDGHPKKKAGFDGYIQPDYQEGLKVEIKCQITPDNATEKRLNYIYDESQKIYKLKINEDGTATIEFLKTGVATITIKSTDNVGVSIKIEIFALKF